MVADLIRVMWDLGLSVRSSVSVRGVLVRHIECSSSNADLSTVLFRDCYFSRIEVDTDLDQSKLPVFSQCYVEELDGRVSESDLPQGRFKECEISSFVTTTETMAKVLELEIPLGSRVCLTILKKLYERSGSGRKENALYRGLNTHARRLVPTVLKILQSENLAIPIKTRGTTIWLPSRNHRARVGRIIAAPATVSDPVLQRCSSD